MPKRAKSQQNNRLLYKYIQEGPELHETMPSLLPASGTMG